MVCLEFYFLFIKFPPKFKRTGSAYILVYFFILFICVFCCFCTILLSHPLQSLFLFLYNSVIPSFTEPVFVFVQFCYLILYRACFCFQQDHKIQGNAPLLPKQNLKNKENKYNLTLSIEMRRFLFNPPFFRGLYLQFY